MRLRPAASRETMAATAGSLAAVASAVFEWAARAGGFTSRVHHEPGASALGHTQLTIDHFEVDAANRGLE